MAQLRQQLLFLNLSNSSPESRVVAWAFYDGALRADESQMQSGDSEEPPYRSVLAAMQDGWRVMQVPAMPHFETGREFDTGHLPFEFVLERMVELENNL
jgi:hypothetical protein